MIWPLASMRPAICDGAGPVTRFSATALAEGWLNVTLCWLPTLKLFQSMAARWEDWSIRVLLPVWLIAAAPPPTLPPVGRAFGAGCAAAGSDAIAAVNVSPVCSAVPSSRLRAMADSPIGTLADPPMRTCDASHGILSRFRYYSAALCCLVDLVLRFALCLGPLHCASLLKGLLCRLHSGPSGSQYSAGLRRRCLGRFSGGKCRLLLLPDPSQPGGKCFHLGIAGGEAGRGFGFAIYRGLDCGNRGGCLALGAQAFGQPATRFVRRHPAKPQQCLQRIAAHGCSIAARSSAKLSSIPVCSSRACRSIVSMRGASATASSTAPSLPAR